MLDGIYCKGLAVWRDNNSEINVTYIDYSTRCCSGKWVSLLVNVVFTGEGMVLFTVVVAHDSFSDKNCDVLDCCNSGWFIFSDKNDRLMDCCNSGRFIFSDKNCNVVDCCNSGCFIFSDVTRIVMFWTIVTVTDLASVRIFVMW